MLVLTGPLSGTDLALAAAGFGWTRPMWGQRARCTSSATAFTGAMDAAKRTAKFLHHGVKRDLERSAPTNEHVVVTGRQRRRRSKPNELAKPAPHPVALHGVANLLADRETHPRRPELGPRAGLQDKGAGMSARAGPGSLGNGPKVTPAFQPLHCSDFGMTAF